MIVFENMIIVGGTGRNTGKTTLAEKLIKKFGEEFQLTAVKMANIKPGNERFHGHNVVAFTDKIRIEKETRKNGNKDSMRFLKAGAVESWFVQTEDVFLSETFGEIEKILYSSQWIICESNSLRKFISPALFIMVKGDGNLVKKDVSGLLQMADLVVDALDWEQFDALVEKIGIRKGKFVLSD